MNSIDSPVHEDATASPARESWNLSLQEALALGSRLMLGKHFDEAEQIYLAILSHWEAQPDALNLFGVLRHLQGRYDEALALIGCAVAEMPDAPGPRNNLGNVLMRLERLDEAVTAYESAVALGGDRREAAEAQNNLARLHRKRGDLERAEAACRRAIEIDATRGEAWYELSLILMRSGRVHDGIIANSRAVKLFPRHRQPRESVVRALVFLGELDEAATLWREWLAEEPDNPVLRHHLAACLGADAPARASDAYVETVFDGFAASFDAKLQRLQYRAPELVAAAVARAFGEPRAALDIADAGCGTGLCGPLVRPWAKSLVGFDLSTGMLERAAPREVYDQLVKAELVAYLEDHPARFDLVISADTLCYFGELDAALRGAARALRTGGGLVFTVEALDEAAPHRLQPHGRYAHGRDYVEAAVAAAGFASTATERVVLRSEMGRDVAGWLVTARV